MSPTPPTSRARPGLSALRALIERVLEAPDLERLTALLARELPPAAGLESVALLLWDRKLDSFLALSPGETRIRPVRPEEPGVAAPDARYLIADGQLIETASGSGEGALLPLQARSGLVGMLVLGRRRGRRRRVPFRPSELRLLSLLAARAALALENHLYQRELLASERMTALGSMASMLAHDFRGPMTVIRGYAETLAGPELPEAEIRARAELIVQAVDRLERMTGETLDFARGGGRVSLRRLPLRETLAEIAREVAAELPGLELEAELDVPDVTALLDADKLRRAVSNVAANARDAMGGAGRFLLTARVSDGALVLRLADFGPGVAPEVRAHVFEPFVTHGKKSGTGLGLAVARRFVEDHGGRIELLADGPGARFEIRLPLEPAL